MSKEICNLMEGTLPNGWEVVSAGIFKKKKSTSFNVAKEEQRIVELYSVPSHEIGVPEILDNKEIGSNKQYVAEGDVLLSKINPRLNRAWVVGNHSSHDKIASTEWIVFEKSDRVIPGYLKYALTTNRVRDYLAHNASGVGGSLTRVKPAIMDSVFLGIPCVGEQKRIVARIEETFSELDNGIAALKTAHEQLKTYRQAILKHAFEGKLTAQWRKENADKLETPEQLLARIQQERQARYHQQLETWKQALKQWEANNKQGKKPSKPKPLKELLNLSPSLLDSLPAIPAGWAWQKLGWMTCGVQYGTSAKSSESGLVPVIRMGNMQKGVIDWSDLVFTSNQAEINEYNLQAGDVLFNRTNSPELVGKTAKFTGTRRAIYAGYLIRINHNPQCVDSSYLTYFLNSGTAQQYGNTVKTDGVNQSNINGNKLQDYPFPFCSLIEQKEVVNQIESKLSAVDSMEANIDAQLARAEVLRQSILKKAFSGQLVCPSCK